MTSVMRWHACGAISIPREKKSKESPPSFFSPRAFPDSRSRRFAGTLLRFVTEGKTMRRYISIRALLAGVLSLSFSALCLAQKDPGVRGGPPGAGGPISGLQVNENALFVEGLKRVTQLESVCDTCNDVTLGGDTGQDPNLATLTNSSGLGVRFNGDQCSVCHQQPAIGGSGGFLVANPQDSPNHYRKPENPMFDLIPHRKGGENYVPSFITPYGPIREVRFQKNPDGTPDGGVHALFTVVGRSDIGAAGCTAAVLPQTDLETQYPKGNQNGREPALTP